VTNPRNSQLVASGGAQVLVARDWHTGFPQGFRVSTDMESQGIEEVRECRRNIFLSDCATVAVILLQVRSIMSYIGLLGLDFYYLFILFQSWSGHIFLNNQGN